MAVITAIDGTKPIKENYHLIEDNDAAINDQLEKHVAGTADKHKTSDIDNDSSVAGSNQKNVNENLQTELDGFQDQLTQIIEETDLDPNKDPEVTNARDSEENGVFSTVKERLDFFEDFENSTFNADADRYIGNQKLGEDGQDVGDWTSASGTLSQDTTNVKIGSGSIKLLENDNTANALSTVKNNISLDFSKLSNDEVSTDDDFISLIVYISNFAKLTSYRIQLCQDAVFSDTNMKSYAVSSGLATGWNYVKIKKSDFDSFGVSAWDGIQSMRFRWDSLANAQNEFVSLQLIQLVKKHPTLDQPHYFQKNGVSEYNDISGEYYVGKEFGFNAWKELNNLSNVKVALKGETSFKNCIANMIAISNSNNSVSGLSWGTDESNRISTFVSGDSLFLQKVESGSSSVLSLPIDSISIGDKIEYTIEKQGSNVKVIGVVNGKRYELTDTTVLTSGEVAFGTFPGIKSPNILNMSITRIAHAHHADIAEVAKTVNVKYKNNVFTADELNYGEFGVDTANDRLYMKYSATQVIYFAGVVV